MNVHTFAQTGGVMRIPPRSYLIRFVRDLQEGDEMLLPGLATVGVVIPSAYDEWEVIYRKSDGLGGTIESSIHMLPTEWVYIPIGRK